MLTRLNGQLAAYGVSRTTGRVRHNELDRRRGEWPRGQHHTCAAQGKNRSKRYEPVPTYTSVKGAPSRPGQSHVGSPNVRVTRLIAPDRVGMLALDILYCQ